MALFAMTFAVVFPVAFLAMVVVVVIVMAMVIAFTYPVFLDKVNGLAAGCVAVAVLSPVFLVARRNVQVNGTLVHRNG
jgi:uncharacterized membrane protein required for colicin V production